MSDWRFERRFSASALNIDMNPLMVKRGVGELLDAFLRYVEPISYGNFLADEIFESLRRIESAFGHICVIPSVARDHYELIC